MNHKASRQHPSRRPHTSVPRNSSLCVMPVGKEACPQRLKQTSELFDIWAAKIEAEEQAHRDRGALTDTDEEPGWSLRRKAVAIITVLGASAALLGTFNRDSAHESATEKCVNALVEPSQRPIDLVQVAEGGTLQHPPEVRQEQLACEGNGNDIKLARRELGR